jgi:hypothetical protein
MTDMHDEDLLQLPEALAASLARLRHRYGNVCPPAPGPALSAFTGVGLAELEGDLAVGAESRATEPAAQVIVLSNEPTSPTSPTRRRRRAKSVVATVAGTTVGKLVLGTTVAAACAGIGQWAGVVDIPGLPDRKAAVAPVVADADGGDADESTDEGPTTTEVLSPADTSGEVGDPTQGAGEPAGADRTTKANRGASGREHSDDGAGDESTDSGKDRSGDDAYGRDYSDDESSDEGTVPGTDSGKDESDGDAYGSDYSGYSDDGAGDEGTDPVTGSVEEPGKDAYSSDYDHVVSGDPGAGGTDSDSSSGKDTWVGDHVPEGPARESQP